MCRWREMRACHGNVCEESKRQNFHESFLDLAFLIDATTHKWGCTKIPAKAAIGLEGALSHIIRAVFGGILLPRVRLIRAVRHNLIQ